MKSQTEIGNHPVSEAEIHAYVDGELAPQRRAAVTAYLAQHPDEAARVEKYMKQNMALHQLFPREQQAALSLEELDLIADLEAAVAGTRPAAPRSRMPKTALAAAAAVAFVVIGGWGVYERYYQGPNEIPFAEQAIEAHRAFVEAAAPDSATSPDVSTQPSGAVIEVDGARLQPPDLSELGYQVSAERTMPTSHGPVAQLLYTKANTDKQVILYIRVNAGNGTGAFSFVNYRDQPFLHWQDGRLSFALFGNLPRAEFLEIARVLSPDKHT